MLSMFSNLDLALDVKGFIVSNGNGSRSAAKDLLTSKSIEKQAEAKCVAMQALRKQQQQQQNQKEQPVTALSQALSLFDKEMDERDSFLSRNTKRRQKSGKKTRSSSTVVSYRGRIQRQNKYNRV
ncbi:unnamed protein product [Peronospora belbahrii]|uniref:Uncharacterized protein n=1 Tax=Peronospora belbahrii TaxID=622444 RepID=A0AAU9L5N6_9STRA|nr:unnamed protein product [Peronospora belbahrii]CAH0515415.1 unnamed protein product [Peronospora belbahrii]